MEQIRELRSGARIVLPPPVRSPQSAKRKAVTEPPAEAQGAAKKAAVATEAGKLPEADCARPRNSC
jgi:hypothetical protein